MDVFAVGAASDEISVAFGNLVSVNRGRSAR